MVLYDCDFAALIIFSNAFETVTPSFLFIGKAQANSENVSMTFTKYEYPRVFLHIN